MLKSFIKRLFCKHRITYFVRNIYGDDINQESGYRSWHKCIKCGKYVKKRELANHS